MKKILFRLTLIVVAALMLPSCNNVEDTFCKFPCRFMFNTQRHGISLALNTMTSTPGVFCHVSRVLHKGVSYYRFQNSENQCDSVIFTQEDNLTTVHIGVNNGLIIGFGTFDIPPVFYAYDVQCRNCFDPEAIPVKDYTLSMLSGGLARCKACGRIYNLNTGGNVTQGTAGKNLWRYSNASCNAMVVNVVN